MRMRIVTLSAGLLAALLLQAQPAAVPASGGYPIDPVPFTSVKVAPDSFWGRRLQASREVTIPLAFSKCESEGRYENFVKAEKQMHSPVNLGYEVTGYSFDDTDVYKTIEGASYVLQTYPDPKLEAYIDSVLVIVAAAQEPDGYLYTARTMNPEHPHEWAGDKRWVNDEELSHELYNLGHMVEAAVAHWQATGKRNFLDIAIRYADCVCREVGAGAGQAHVIPGHQIAEMALAKLYLATGDKKYLDEAKFFLDERGKTGHNDEYNQSHLPVLEQAEAVGHAVRAAYMYAGMADVAALTGDKGYVDAIDRIWENIVSKKLYITGGIGATNYGEAFGENYQLPNMTAYCETCAAIGNVYVNYRMFLLHGDAKYYDVLERTLYNGLLSGVSLEGNGFFYPNPLESAGQHARKAWFGCACCPSNICRFIPSVPGYVYAVKDNSLYVNLFMPNTMTQKVAGKDVTLTQKTGYPFDGDIEITIDKTDLKKEMTLRIRIPGWVRGQAVPSDLYTFADDAKTGYTVTLNGQRIKAIDLEHGYFDISRKWKKGDKVVVHFDMEPRLVKAHPAVQADVDRVAVQKGPIVYCAEWPDNPGFSVRGAVVSGKPSFRVKHTDELFGVDKVVLPARASVAGPDGRPVLRDVDLTLIPYYAWCHRGSGEMAVWLPQTAQAALPDGPYLTVGDAAAGIPIQPTMYGIFLEDINFAADGGLYAEKVMNRSFEFDNPLQGWKTYGKVEVLAQGGPFARNPHFVRLKYPGHPVRRCGLENAGWFGIGLEEGAEYRLSFWARTSGKPASTAVSVALVDPAAAGERQALAAQELTVKGAKWAKYEVVLTSPVTLPKAVLRVMLGDKDPAAAVDLEHISLFPMETFRGDENGLRKDLAQALADLRPGILRFPGGCIVEGTDLANRYQWKNTVGPVENRPINLNRWSYDQDGRMYPDYYQSGGLGFYEYFRLAEEIGAEPVPIVSCGMACQFENDPATNPDCPLDQLGTYIQDALDLIEFANSSAKTKWGKVRADMGHPEPFNLKYLGIGNEQWGEEFIKRFEPFYKAVRAKYPAIQIVGTSGPFASGEWFDDLWAEMRRLDVDLVDEHYYSNERFFEGNATRYDNYPRTGPKVFAGEYACHGADGKKLNHFNAALLEASFMTGLERNADVVLMSSYAPTFAHVEGWQWRPDLIWFDNLRVMRSSSYWVQWLYGNNKGSRALPLTAGGKPVTGEGGLTATCAVDDATGDLIVKLANLSPSARELAIDLPGDVCGAERTVLHSDNPMDENTLDEPERVIPVTETVDFSQGARALESGRAAFCCRVGGRTFAVYRFHRGIVGKER